MNPEFHACALDLRAPIAFEYEVTVPTVTSDGAGSANGGAPGGGNASQSQSQSQSQTARVEKLIERLRAAEKRLQALEEKANDEIARVKADLAAKKVYAYKLVTVPDNYYDRSMEERAGILGCSVPQMCKSIVFENTAATHDSMEDMTNSRYYCVIVQYAAKFDAEMLRDVIHELRKPEDRLSRKKFHFQLAPEEVNDKLTGFTHNAVTPFGMMSKIPIVLCKRCLDMEPKFMFFGGGKVNVKLGMSIADFRRALNPIVALISHPR
jgi:prolyl-tRNA editing enzyme YbaK/EbsC (Cys-tRNA(Pro) deacylase)